MHTYDVNAPGSTRLVMNEHNGNFIGVQSLAPGFEQAVVSQRLHYNVLLDFVYFATISSSFLVTFEILVTLEMSKIFTSLCELVFCSACGVC